MREARCEKRDARDGDARTKRGIETSPYIEVTRKSLSYVFGENVYSHICHWLKIGISKRVSDRS